MASNVTIIGKTTRVRGRVHGPGDLEVQGFVDGEIVVTGDVTVALHGMVGAGIRGRRVVVRGAVKGDLVGDEAVLLEDGARVVGDVHAPRVAIGPGALVRGYVETGEGGAAPARTARVQPAVRPAVAPAAVSHTPERAPAVVASKPAAAKAVEPPARAAPAAASNSGPRRPPPLVVPVLKGAKGQIAKKRER